MMKEIEALAGGAYGAIVGLLVTITHDWFFIKLLQWPEAASLLGAFFLGALLLLIYELLIKSKFIKRRFSPFSKIEGAWRIHIPNNADRPSSVCKIYFSRKDYVYRGYGINNDGTLGSEWSSLDLHYDETHDEITFTADASILNNGRRIRNYGYIKFFKNVNSRFDYGNGYFVDMADELSQAHMTLTRLEEAEFDRIVIDSFEKTKAKSMK